MITNFELFHILKDSGILNFSNGNLDIFIMPLENKNEIKVSMVEEDKNSTTKIDIKDYKLNNDIFNPITLIKEYKFNPDSIILDSFKTNFNKFEIGNLGIFIGRSDDFINKRDFNHYNINKKVNYLLSDNRLVIKTSDYYKDIFKGTNGSNKFKDFELVPILNSDKTININEFIKTNNYLKNISNTKKSFSSTEWLISYLLIFTYFKELIIFNMSMVVDSFNDRYSEDYKGFLLNQKLIIDNDKLVSDDNIRCFISQFIKNKSLFSNIDKEKFTNIFIIINIIMEFDLTIFDIILLFENIKSTFNEYKDTKINLINFIENSLIVSYNEMIVIDTEILEDFSNILNPTEPKFSYNNSNVDNYQLKGIVGFNYWFNRDNLSFRIDINNIFYSIINSTLDNVTFGKSEIISIEDSNISNSIFNTSYYIDISDNAFLKKYYKPNNIDVSKYSNFNIKNSNIDNLIQFNNSDNVKNKNNNISDSDISNCILLNNNLLENIESTNSLFDKSYLNSSERGNAKLYISSKLYLNYILPNKETELLITEIEY